MPRPYDLPSLGDLSCFEAAARNLSFKAAASELNVTPAAVSHRIKALEREVGQPLFNRHYRGVELTEAGALLFVSLQRGFEGISESVARIRSRHDRSGVSIAATTAMSGLWLTPRLAAFWKAHPGVAISQMIEDYGRARALYSQACDGGSMRGCNNLGVLYDHGRGVAENNARARALFRQACNGGNENACENLDKM